MYKTDAKLTSLQQDKSYISILSRGVRLYTAFLGAHFNDVVSVLYKKTKNGLKYAWKHNIKDALADFESALKVSYTKIPYSWLLTLSIAALVKVELKALMKGCH